MLMVKAVIATINILFAIVVFLISRNDKDKNGRVVSRFVEFLMVVNTLLLFA